MPNNNPTEKVRLSLQLSKELNQAIEEIEASTGNNRTEIIRQALALMKVAHAARQNGKHIGLVRDPTKLDTEIVGVM